MFLFGCALAFADRRTDTMLREQVVDNVLCSFGSSSSWPFTTEVDTLLTNPEALLEVLDVVSEIPEPAGRSLGRSDHVKPGKALNSRLSRSAASTSRVLGSRDAHVMVSSVIASVSGGAVNLIISLEFGFAR